MSSRIPGGSRGCSRPATALGYVTPGSQRNNNNDTVYIDTETKIAGDFVPTHKFRESLEKFYNQSGPSDKAKCIELMTSMDLSDEFLKQAKSHEDERLWYNAPPRFVTPHGHTERPLRPKSAAPNFTYGDGRDDGKDPHNPYTTSYEMHYPSRPFPEGISNRSPSTRFPFQFSHALSDPLHNDTHYHDEYYDKNHQSHPTPPRPPGDRSRPYHGHPENRPHPAKMFMVWKIPPTGPCKPTGITEKEYDKALRGSLRTTYQMEYLGYPLGVEKPKCASDVKDDWKSQVKYDTGTTMRQTNKYIEQPDVLKISKTRYGSNKLKNAAAVGAVPSVGQARLFSQLKTRTTYDRHYNDTVPHPPPDVRTMAKKYASRSIKNHMITVPLQQQEELTEVVNQLDQPPNYCSLVRPPTQTASRDPYKRVVDARRVIIPSVSSPVNESWIYTHSTEYPMPCMDLEAY